MFLNHETSFDTFTPVNTKSAFGHTITATGSTLFETSAGWQQMDTLQQGDTIATLDGGFATIRDVSRSEPVQLVNIPAGTLGTCTDILMPVTTSVALHLPASVSASPIVSVPLHALCGWQGIRRQPGQSAPLTTATFADEAVSYTHLTLPTILLV